jgi:uncharacterized protein (DUF362 family)
MKIRNYEFKKDSMDLFKPKNMKEIVGDIEEIFKANERILPKGKDADILIKPNFNNDLNALTGNSTDLRIIVGVLKALKKRSYKNITIADGPNCGVNHIGIDVFSRLTIDCIAKKYGVGLKNLNKEGYKKVNLTTSTARIAKRALDSDFIINLPKIKTHMEAKMTVSCKNLMGCFLGTEKRRMHDNLAGNIVRLNEIIKTDLIIVDGLVCMEGDGPGDGIPKKLGILLSGHNTYLMDLLCSKLMGLNHNKIPFLKIASKKGHINNEDIENLKKFQKIAKFLPAKKSIFGRLLLNNFFIEIRFLKPFQKIFDSGFVPWFLYKLKVRQDIYIHEERNIKKFYENPDLKSKEKEKVKTCLELYCPLENDSLDEKNCIKCMYCYQILPKSIKYDGDLGAFKMQLDRFGKYVSEDER